MLMKLKKKSQLEMHKLDHEIFAYINQEFPQLKITEIEFKLYRGELANIY
jgi:hypothetical protein